jgi:polysaccharide export outer membrane protein
MRRTNISIVLRHFLWMAVFVFGCGMEVPAQTPPASLPGKAEDSAPPSSEEIKAVLAADAAARKGPYLIQPGDELSIREFNISDLDLDVRVRPDGKISVLLLDDVEVAGKTTEEVAETLSRLYSKRFRNPRITVIIRNFYNFNVYVGGEVSHPGLVSLSGGLTVASAVFQAGGFKEEEGPRKVVLIRRTATGGQSIMNLDLEDVLVRGQPDIMLQPSDVLYVPRNTINVYVGGEVVEPGLVPLNGKLTALAAILRARGLKSTARAKNVMLLRNTGRDPDQPASGAYEGSRRSRPAAIRCRLCSQIRHRAD